MNDDDFVEMPVGARVCVAVCLALAHMRAAPLFVINITLRARASENSLFREEKAKFRREKPQLIHSLNENQLYSGFFFALLAT